MTRRIYRIELFIKYGVKIVVERVLELLKGSYEAIESTTFSTKNAQFKREEVT